MSSFGIALRLFGVLFMTMVILSATNSVVALTHKYHDDLWVQLILVVLWSVTTLPAIWAIWAIVVCVRGLARG